MEKQENLINLEKLVFSIEKGEVFIGGEKLKPEILSVLKEQARYIETSHFYEVLNATIINESARLALLDSKDWDGVQYAKALYYWNKIIKKMIKGLQQ